MISRSEKGNFLTAHYDRLAVGVGLLALAGAVAYFLFGSSVEEEIAEVVGRVEGRKVAEATVAEQDMSALKASVSVTKAQEGAKRIREKSETLFASGWRRQCANGNCGRATPLKLDETKNLVCSFCGFTQEVAKAEVEADSDQDGMPDKWEIRNGLNPKDAADAATDPDGDEFSNLEEYGAKTDPRDRKDHPDYLDSLAVAGPLKETYLPFVLLSANKIPTGWRCEFFDAKQKDDYGRLGRTLTALVGEEIGKSGYVLREYEKKSAKRAIKGSVNQREVDVSEAVVERKRDGKKIRIVVAENKKAKPAAVDVQATLTYTRGSKSQTLEVVTGTVITLSGTTYKVVSVAASGKGSVVIEGPGGKRRTFPCP